MRILLVGHDGDDSADMVAGIAQHHPGPSADVDAQRQQHVLLLEGVRNGLELVPEGGVVGGRLDVFLARHQVQVVAEPVEAIQLFPQLQGQADAGVVVGSDRRSVAEITS